MGGEEGGGNFLLKLKKHMITDQDAFKVMVWSVNTKCQMKLKPAETGNFITAEIALFLLGGERWGGG